MRNHLPVRLRRAMREMNRNLNVRNFGLRSRDVGRALISAYRLKGNGKATNATVKTALIAFKVYLKNEFNINDLRKVNRSHVLAFASNLNDKFERGEISASTAQNYLSPVNVALENARLDQSCKVDGVRSAGLPSRSGIADRYKGVTLEQHERAKSLVSERLSVQLDLQRELGLRLKESCLINAKATLEQALLEGKVDIIYGTKGGRLRTLNIESHSQIETLQRAAILQGKNYSLIPEKQTWSQYQAQVYRDISNTGINFHAERHHFANDLYEKIVGCESPVKARISHTQRHIYMADKLAVSLLKAKQIDIEARLYIAKALGHSRVSISNNYLG